MAFQCSTLSSRNPRLAPKPAFANTASSLPKCSVAVATAACWSSQIVTSQLSGIATSVPPRSEASDSSLSCERAASATRHPVSTACWAVAAPMPLLAPVMRSTGESVMAPVLAPLRYSFLMAAARFPGLHAEQGHYESFYLKACHPTEPVALWLRHTVHKAPGASATGSLWFTLFDSRARGPWAVKQTFAGPSTSAAEYIRVGEASLTAATARGRAEGRGHTAAWDLSYESRSEPLFHLPRPWMYRSPLPRTKLLTPHPDARFHGRLEVDGEEVDVAGWRGMVGHNWGAQHAQRWIWIHATGFDDDHTGWIDVALGRIRLGRFTTPWIANGALFLEGQRLRLGGLARASVTEVREEADRCVLALPGREL